MDHIKEIPSPTSVSEPTMPSSSPSFGARVKSHLKRFWWAHLIFFVVCTLVIVLPLVYVGFPRIAQDKINASTLTVTSIILTNPSTNSFHLLQNTTVGNPSAYHPRLDAFNASLALEDNPLYAYVELPALHATETAVSIVDQDVKITNADAFNDYNVAVLNQEEVTVNVKGRTGLHEGKLPKTDVDYDKTAAFKGLNKFTGFNVTSFSIKLEPEADGTNMIGEVYIPNPSILTLTMGNVTFNNTIPATKSQPATFIGTSTINDLVLGPGNNTVPMRSVINQTLVIEALATTYKTGILPVDIVGVSSVYDGQHLPYYEKALQSLTQHISLDVGSALKEVGVDPASLAGLGGSPP